MAANWTGFFDSSGSPAIKLTIAGVVPQSQQEFDGIIDTGFTGFISMPLFDAFPLGLILSGTTSVMLADASTGFRLTALGAASIGGELQSGLIILDVTASDILLGMDFLRKFQKVLQVNPMTNSVTLVDETLPAGATPPDDPNEAGKAVADQVAALTEDDEETQTPGDNQDDTEDR